MAARANAIPAQLAENVVSLLTHISRDVDATRWLTNPRLVGLGPFIGELTSAKRPVVFVEVRGGDDLPQTAEVHRGRVSFEVRCFTESERPRDAHIEALNMVADVMRAITDDETLKAHPAVIIVNPMSWQIEPSQSESLGAAQALVRFDVDYEWQHGAP